MKTRLKKGSSAIILLALGLVFIVSIMPNVEARKNIEDVGITLDKVILAHLKNNLTSSFPSYAEIIQIVPDTSNQEVSGKLRFDKNGFFGRSQPQYNNHFNFYKYEEPITWIDPPNNIRDKIKIIEIRSKLPYYFINGSFKKKDDTITLAQKIYVNDRCNYAVITADNWIFDIWPMIIYMQHNCDPEYKYFNEIVKIYQEPTKYNYCGNDCQYKKWLKDAKEKSKQTFLIDPDKELKNQIGEVTRSYD